MFSTHEYIMIMNFEEGVMFDCQYVNFNSSDINLKI